MKKNYSLKVLISIIFISNYQLHGFENLGEKIKNNPISSALFGLTTLYTAKKLTDISKDSESLNNISKEQVKEEDNKDLKEEILEDNFLEDSSKDFSEPMINEININNIGVGLYEIKGEDNHYFNNENKSLYFGVYDGHGINGKYASEYLSQNLHLNIINNVNFNSKTKLAIKEGFQKTNDELKNGIKTESTFEKSGSTSVIGIIRGDNLYVANLGDSRIVLCQEGKAIALSKDHKASDPDEQKIVEKAGGVAYCTGVNPSGNKVYRVNGCILISRAFGDFAIKGITANPDINKFKITDKDEFLILASDGLWDVVGNQEAVDFVKKEIYENNSNLDEVAKILVDKAYEKGSRDDITVMIVKLN